MEDFDKYLDRLVENFYDTGKLVLNERTNKSIDDKDDYEVLRNFWLKYKQLPRHNRLTIRYKIISTDNIYILKDNKLQPYNENIKLEHSYVYL